MRKDYLTNPRKAEEAEAITAILVNTAVWAARLAAGFLTNSIALIADAWHSMSDNVTSVAVLTGSKLASRPPDKEHPYGHGKIADLVSLFMGLALVVVAAYVAYEAVRRSLGGYAIEQSYVLPALAVVATTSLVKEGLARYALRLARSSGSPLCRADAWHHRVDALVGLAVVPSLASYMLTGTTIVDLAAGIAIGLAIGREGFRIVKEASSTLIDSLDSRVESLVKDVARGVEGVEHVHDVRVRSYGGFYFVELKLHVSPNIDVAKAHEIAHTLEDRVRERERRIVELTTHIEPSGE